MYIVLSGVVVHCKYVRLFILISENPQSKPSTKLLFYDYLVFFYRMEATLEESSVTKTQGEDEEKPTSAQSSRSATPVRSRKSSRDSGSSHSSRKSSRESKSSHNSRKSSHSSRKSSHSSRKSSHSSRKSSHSSRKSSHSSRKSSRSSKSSRGSRRSSHSSSHSKSTQ